MKRKFYSTKTSKFYTRINWLEITGFTRAQLIDKCKQNCGRLPKPGREFYVTTHHLEKLEPIKNMNGLIVDYIEAERIYLQNNAGTYEPRTEPILVSRLHRNKR